MSPQATPKPNFLILGAAKSGTTSLCYYVAQHPEVCFSEPKEPVFFESEYERGLDFYLEKYFGHWQGEPAVGEGRVYNLFLPFVPERVRELLPEARLIAILRDPVERAFSHWWHRYSRGQERLGFEDAVERNIERLHSGPGFAGPEGAERWRKGLQGVATRYPLYLELGFYAEQLERYLERFPRSRIRVFVYEDLAADPAAVVRELWELLGVQPDHPLADDSPQNERRDRIMSPAVAKLLRLARSSGLRRLVPRPLRSRALQALPEREGSRPALSPATRRALVPRFESDVRRLEGILDRDLSAWRQP